MLSNAEDPRRLHAEGIRAVAAAPLHCDVEPAAGGRFLAVYGRLMPAQRSAGGRWPLRSRAPLPHCRPLAARPPPPLWLAPAHLAPRPVPRPAPPPARPIPACYFSTTQSRPSPPPPRCPLAPPMPWRPPCLIDPGEGRRLRPGRGRAHLAGLAGTRTLMRPPPPRSCRGLRRHQRGGDGSSASMPPARRTGGTAIRATRRLPSPSPARVLRACCHGCGLRGCRRTFSSPIPRLRTAGRRRARWRLAGGRGLPLRRPCV